ncbi:DUF4760 domain-containing protein [Longispora albida]|uniref:DUF4760 domain-containing protein n=1 Tax=Longispora albida TaxID=203523 RepID=UPI00036FF855|nr:DUF4760 domain-containing protein [Longispora albida]
MSTFEGLSVAAAFSAIVVNAVVAGAFLWLFRKLGHQVRESVRAGRAGHDRQRLQATIEFYASTLSIRAQLRAVLPGGRDAEAAALLVKEEGDAELTRLVSEYLGQVELLAAGVRTDVFDLTLIERAAGTRLRSIADGYRPWIEHCREQSENPRLYEELLWLAGELERRRAGRIAQSRLSLTTA